MIATPWTAPLRNRGHRWPLAATILAVLLVAGACGTRASTADANDRRVFTPSPRGPVCELETFPAELPGADMLVDSAALASAVRDLGDVNAFGGGYVLFSLEYDRDGLGVRRDVIEHSTSRQVADSIRRMIFSTSREVDDADRDWGVRLRLDVGEPVTMEIGRREYCPPVARNFDMYRAMQSYRPAGVRVRRGVRERTVHVRAHVGELGTITAARIVRGELSGGTLEREMLIHLQQFLFNPATVDGVPTGAWVEIPVRIVRPQ